MSSVTSSKPQWRSASRAPGPELLKMPVLSRPRWAANQSKSSWSSVPEYQVQ
jgi:hypothetical protein